MEKNLTNSFALAASTSHVVDITESLFNLDGYGYFQERVRCLHGSENSWTCWNSLSVKFERRWWWTEVSKVFELSVVVLCMIPEAYNVITNGDRVPSCHPNLLLEVSTLESHAMKLVCFWQMKPGPQGMLGSVVLCLQRTGAGRHVSCSVYCGETRVPCTSSIGIEY